MESFGAGNCTQDTTCSQLIYNQQVGLQLAYEQVVGVSVNSSMHGSSNKQERPVSGGWVWAALCQQALVAPRHDQQATVSSQHDDTVSPASQSWD
jgi:hypothetical protein